MERGDMTPEDLAEMEKVANIGPGACALMGTANCMNILTEAMGMTLTDGALTPATYGARIALARKSGRRIMELHRKNILPRDIMTANAFENAIAVDMAIGGSTNSCLHLPAIAREVGIEISMELFSRIAEKTPHLTLLKPAGQYFPKDLYEAGGVTAIMNELSRHGLIHPECMTVTGNPIGKNIAESRNCRRKSNSPGCKPPKPEGRDFLSIRFSGPGRGGSKKGGCSPGNDGPHRASPSL